MPTQKENRKLIESQIISVIEKYGIRRINDQIADNSGFPLLALSDTRSIIFYEKDESGDFKRFFLYFGNNLDITTDIKNMAGFKEDFDDNEFYSYLGFRVTNLNDEIKILQEQIDNLTHRIKKRYYEYQRDRIRMENEKEELQAKIEKINKTKTKKKFIVYCPSDKSTITVSSVIANAMFNKILKQANKLIKK